MLYLTGIKIPTDTFTVTVTGVCVSVRIRDYTNKMNSPIIFLSAAVL